MVDLKSSFSYTKGLICFASTCLSLIDQINIKETTVYKINDKGDLLNKKIIKILSVGDIWHMTLLSFELKIHKICCQKNFQPQVTFSISLNKNNSKCFTVQENFEFSISHNGILYVLRVSKVQVSPSGATFCLLRS